MKLFTYKLIKTYKGYPPGKGKIQFSIPKFKYLSLDQQLLIKKDKGFNKKYEKGCDIDGVIRF